MKNGVVIFSVSNCNQFFRYCNENGIIGFELIPSVYLENIASIYDTNSAILRMMRYPEKAAGAILGNHDGLMRLKWNLGMTDA